MRKILQTILFIISASGVAIGQDIIFTISGELNNQKVPLDSIMVENLSNNTWMTFNDLPDEQYYQINLTKKAFWGTVGTNDFNSGTGFIEVQNLPGSLVLSFRKNTPERINLAIFNIAGQKIYSESNKLINPGNSIKVQPGATGVYLVKIETPQGTQSFKVIGQTLNTVNKVEVIDWNPVITPIKNASFSVEDNFSYNIGDSIRVSIFKSNHFASPLKRKLNISENLKFFFEDLSDSTLIVTAGKLQLNAPGLDFSEMKVLSSSYESDVNINGTFQIPNDIQDGNESPVLFSLGDNLLFGAIPVSSNGTSITLDEVLLFYLMFFPDVAFMGVNPQELLELVQSNENYLQLLNLLSTSFENNMPPTDNSQFVDLLKITAQNIALKNREALKSASAVNDFFDNEFAFKFKRDGDVEWRNPAPIFASMGFEIQTRTGTPITDPIIIDPSQWVFAPTSILTWLLDNSFFSTNKKQTLKLEQNGEYVFVFTNGNEKGKSSETLYNEVKNTNNAAFVTSVVLFVVPFALKKYLKEKKCATELTNYFTQKATVLRDLILSGEMSKGKTTSEILKYKDGFNELIVSCSTGTGNETTGIFKKFNDFIQTVFNSLNPLDDAESVANLISLARDFYGTKITGEEVRYFYNGVSFGELDYKAVSEKTFKGMPETEYQYEAKVEEKLVKYDVERGILSSEFIRKDSLGDANELPFKATLIKGDAKVINTNPKVQAGSLFSEFEMGKDSSIVIITPDFPYNEIVPDTIRLFPENNLKQLLIDLSPWKSVYAPGVYDLLHFTENSLIVETFFDDQYARSTGSWSIISDNSILIGDVTIARVNITDNPATLSILCKDNPGATTGENDECDDLYFISQK